VRVVPDVATLIRATAVARGERRDDEAGAHRVAVMSRRCSPSGNPLAELYGKNAVQ
jgi:hypothetical protein